MAWVAVNDFSLEDTPINQKERIFEEKPERAPNGIWNVKGGSPGVGSIGIGLPEGTIYKILGRKLTWDNEPINLE